MRISPGIGHEPSLQRLVIASGVLHFILMVLLFVPFKTEREFKTYYVSLAEPAKVRGGGQTAARKAEEKPVLKKEAPAEKKSVEKKAVPEKKDLEQKMALKEKKKAAEEKANKDKEDAIALIAAKQALAKKKADRDKNRGIEAVPIKDSGKGGQGPWILNVLTVTI